MREVPPRNDFFVGRDRTLLELRDQLAALRPATVALHGMAGIGKTQLAREFAWRFAADYQLVWWIDAAGGLTAQAGVAAVNDALGEPVPAGPAGTAQAVVRALSRMAATGRPWLLIYDNVEDVQDVADLLPHGGHILITSRSRAFRQVGTPTPVEPLARAETVELLTRRIDGLDPALADLLATEIGDLPLAAAQIAAYLDTTPMDPAAYLGLFRAEQARIAALGHPVDYPRTAPPPRSGCPPTRSPAGHPRPPPCSRCVRSSRPPASRWTC
ncbi:MULTISPECIES: AAA family ATPase [unclassified Frankia]|uniref:AAA family ATPase n=1 Tax=unclassified Frankia TaxID=2632575 RepID=UPI0020258332